MRTPRRPHIADALATFDTQALHANDGVGQTEFRFAMLSDRGKICLFTPSCALYQIAMSINSEARSTFECLKWTTTMCHIT